MDEVEINAIDSLAALKYINYEQIILHNTLEVDLNYIREQMRQTGEDYHYVIPEWSGANTGDIELKKINGLTSDNSITLDIKYFDVDHQLKIVENNGEAELYDISGNISRRVFDSLPYVGSEIIKIYGSDGSLLKIQIITPNTKWKYFIPNSNCKVYYIKTPLTVRTFEVLLNHVLTYVVPLEKVIYYNSLNNFDPSILTKIKISENIFYD